MDRGEVSSAQGSPLGFRENESIAQFEMGSGRNLVYLILNWKTKEALLVDPFSGLERVFDPLDRYGFTLKGILLTHTHWDHVAGLTETLSRVPASQVYVHSLDLFRLSKHGLTAKSSAISEISEGTVIRLGDMRIETLHTPGHSAGACSFLVWSPESSGERPIAIITGDTIFVGDCGRTDLETGSVSAMFESIQKMRALYEKLGARFPEQQVSLLPGHHYSTDCVSLFKDEVEKSAPFLCASPDELAKLP